LLVGIDGLGDNPEEISIPSPQKEAKSSTIGNCIYFHQIMFSGRGRKVGQNKYVRVQFDECRVCFGNNHQSAQMEAQRHSLLLSLSPLSPSPSPPLLFSIDTCVSSLTNVGCVLDTTTNRRRWRHSDTGGRAMVLFSSAVHLPEVQAPTGGEGDGEEVRMVGVSCAGRVLSAFGMGIGEVCLVDIGKVVEGMVMGAVGGLDGTYWGAVYFGGDVENKADGGEEERRTVEGDTGGDDEYLGGDVDRGKCAD
jgi:hypothetical protein